MGGVRGGRLRFTTASAPGRRGGRTWWSLAHHHGLHTSSACRWDFPPAVGGRPPSDHVCPPCEGLAGGDLGRARGACLSWGHVLRSGARESGRCTRAADADGMLVLVRDRTCSTGDAPVVGWRASLPGARVLLVSPLFLRNQLRTARTGCKRSLLISCTSSFPRERVGMGVRVPPPPSLV